jgi:hypothetical protein
MYANPDIGKLTPFRELQLLGTIANGGVDTYMGPRSPEQSNTEIYEGSYILPSLVAK